ncbi:MAG: hypothetical protein RMX65_006665 [Nostoc sp. DedQUE01]|nr:hypothetical protein [Nostoc sp. DedQUE11]MDZ8074962.1 hypothetical protein [Nostoc sp. DedQUE01]
MSGFFGLVMINKNNNVESYASYPEELLKFFAAFRMTTDNICRQSVFLLGMLLIRYKLNDRATSKRSTTKFTLDVSK